MDDAELLVVVGISLRVAGLGIAPKERSIRFSGLAFLEDASESSLRTDGSIDLLLCVEDGLTCKYSSSLCPVLDSSTIDTFWFSLVNGS